ncbi:MULTISPECIES: hypothetical protein [unclassified Bradyrhizobium]|uniref:hypothetical protein n=1 Tax=unclassified Bradyrhizobium TaxID=2631580 RepID=UPI002306944D|nr:MULTISPECIES: hypothetical protein [unclassified Bradyrhizobium]MDA9406381.1 hypothetical protein [Bradyrhizobium sp. CCBAU 45384]MDA9443396.1 hypothetical protein [Bradyrhizobium sp. CCBAU 51745]
MDNLDLMNAELRKHRLELEVVDREVNEIASISDVAVLPALKRASERMREIARRIEVLTAAIAHSGPDGTS